MEKFRLNIVGADEDVPRVMLAYGHGCGGEVAFVMRPRDNTALLVHQVKKQPAKVWRTDLGLAPSHAPELDAAPADAVAEIRKMKVEPAARRARHLARDVEGHAVLHRRDALDRAWSAASRPTAPCTSHRRRTVAGPPRSSARRSGSRRRSRRPSPAPGSTEAITAGMGLVVGLVSEACSFRDTHRRNTVDAEFAAQHPPRVRPPSRRDPTERYKGKSSFRAVERRTAGSSSTTWARSSPSSASARRARPT